MSDRNLKHSNPFSHHPKSKRMKHQLLLCICFCLPFLSISQNVGIGTNNPEAKLEVTDDIQVNSFTIGRGGGSYLDNTVFGLDCLDSNMIGRYLSAFGFLALRNNKAGYRNSAFGYQALVSNVYGSQNTAVGLSALSSNIDGSFNTALGYVALESTLGGHNTGLGSSALGGLQIGSFNVGVGANSLTYMDTASNNTAIGGWSGGMATGSGNVFIGYRAGFNETGNEKLYIANDDTPDPLIFGDFSSDLLRVNGTLNINNSYSFPNSAGAHGQVMVMDSSGTLEWQTQSGGGAGQWSVNGNDIYNTNGGKVGIGVTNPVEPLHVFGQKVLLQSTGTGYLECVSSAAGGTRLSFGIVGGTGDGIVWGFQNRPLKFGTSDALRMTITGSGNVGIGTSTPQSKLAVNGKITAKEVEVTLSGFPDYVFEEDYDLLTLQEVEAHIKEFGHLPNVPSAQEVDENGLGLGEMNKMLLEKVEELTLYAIEKEKEVEALQIEMQKTTDRLSRIEELLLTESENTLDHEK